MHIRLLNEAMDHYGSIFQDEYGSKISTLTSEYIDLKTDDQTRKHLDVLTGGITSSAFDNGVRCGLILAKSLHYILNEPEKAFKDLFDSYGKIENVYEAEIEAVRKLREEKKEE